MILCLFGRHAWGEWFISEWPVRRWIRGCHRCPEIQEGPNADDR
jgi:hypothetical protein